MRVMPARRPEKPPTRWKRVLPVTLIVTVPRSESRRRKVRALRLTDTIVPSYCRGAAWVVGAVCAAGWAAPATAAVEPSAASAAATATVFLILMSISFGGVVGVWDQDALRPSNRRPGAVKDSVSRWLGNGSDGPGGRTSRGGRCPTVNGSERRSAHPARP